MAIFNEECTVDECLAATLAIHMVEKQPALTVDEAGFLSAHQGAID